MILAHALLICAPLQAGPLQGPPVAVQAVPRESSEARFFFISGQQIRIPIRFYGGQGQKLDLRTRPVQLAHSMAAPVGPSIELATGLELGNEAWHDFSLTLDCPPVNLITTWELRHQSRVAGDDTWQSVGTTRIELYPPDLLQPLRKLTTTQRWFVSDPTGRLKGFLTKHGIPFRDLESPGGRQAFERDSAGTEPALVLWVREPVDSERPPAHRRRRPAPAKAARVLIFDEPAPVLPHTTLRLEPHRTSVTVDINMLSSLTDDPRAQMRFVEAVRMTQFDLGDGFDELENNAYEYESGTDVARTRRSPNARSGPGARAGTENR